MSHPIPPRSDLADPSGTTRREFVRLSLLATTLPALATTTGAAPASSTNPPNKPNPALSYPIQPYGKGEAVYVANLDQAQPASAHTDTWQPNQWKRYAFETAETKGTLLSCGQNTGVPDLQLALPVRGWYAISFGILSHYWESRLQVRLPSDPVFSVLTPNNLAEENMMWDDIQWSRHPYNSHGVEELFWRCAEIGGADTSLHLRQLKVQKLPGDPNAFGNIFHACWLAYVKLVRLTDAEVASLQTDRQRRDTRRLFAADDAFSATAFLRFRDADDVRRQIEPYRNTDFSRMYWEAGAGDVTNFPSRVGRHNTQAWMAEHYRLCDRLRSASVTDFAARGLDAFRIALEHSHAVGLEFHASYRVGGFHFPAPEDEWNRGGLYDQHPEWRSLDRLGRPSPRLSYAYAGVRDYVLALHDEIATYPVDGICLLFNRRLPIIGYESVLVDRFIARHGVDPRTLPDEDPRWLAHSAAVLTGFMRDLRQRMRTAQQLQGRKPIGISAVVMSSREENLRYGLDLETWVREGLIDTLIPYSSARGISSRVASWEDPRSTEYFIRLTRGTACTLALNLMPRGITPEDYKRRAHALYEAGVENLFFWDCFGRTNHDPSWTTLSRLGHREELAAWAALGCPPVERPRAALHRIGDWDLSYQTPG